MATDPEKPWVLIRKGIAGTPRFATLAAAKDVHDCQRFNGAARTAASVLGPNNERWTCGPRRWDTWMRDDRLPGILDERAESETTA